MHASECVCVFVCWNVSMHSCQEKRVHVGMFVCIMYVSDGENTRIVVCMRVLSDGVFVWQCMRVCVCAHNCACVRLIVCLSCSCASC